MATIQHLSLENRMFRYYFISLGALAQGDAILANTNLLTLGTGSVGYMECKERNPERNRQRDLSKQRSIN
jgi:hypothetical protein